MSNQELSAAEQKFCMYKLGLTGSFFTGLFGTIFKADDDNISKLALGFPDLVEVVQRYRHEKGYWINLVERWEEKNPSHKFITK